MNKKISLFLLLLAVSTLLFSCTPTASPAEGEQADGMGEAAFSVFCSYATEDGRRSCDGSAVLLASDADGSLLVTALHVLSTAQVGEMPDGIYLHAYGKEAEDGIPAKCVWTDAEHDLALLHTENRLGTPPALRADTPERGTSVFVLGNGGGAGIRPKLGSVTEGLVTLSFSVDYREEPLTLSLICFAAELSSGDSGGGLFDEEGRLLGIVNAMRADGTLGYAIPVSHVAEMLSAYRQP